MGTKRSLTTYRYSIVFRFAGSSSLKVHLRSHTTEKADFAADKSTFPCKYCGKSFTQSNILDHHLITHGIITKNGVEKVETVQVAELL